MGSAGRMNYTLMGDNVNLGARLEGTNKQYSTNIIISESTYAQVKDKVVARELDNIRVKGKNKPTPIFELIDVIEGLDAPPKPTARGGRWRRHRPYALPETVRAARGDSGGERVRDCRTRTICSPPVAPSPGGRDHAAFPFQTRITRPISGSPLPVRALLPFLQRRTDVVNINAYDPTNPADPYTQLTSNGFYPIRSTTDTQASQSIPLIAVSSALAATAFNVQVNITGSGNNTSGIPQSLQAGNYVLGANPAVEIPAACSGCQHSIRI